MIFEFEGPQQLYDFLLSDGKELKGGALVNEFKRHVGNINKGCKCTKKLRVAKAVQAYSRLVHKLDREHSIPKIKSVLGAKTLRFLHKGDLVREV